MPAIPPNNRKLRRLAEAKVRTEPKILFQGTSYTLNEAAILAAEQEQLHNVQAAMDIYRLILAKFPDHVLSLNNLGMLLQHSGHLEQAIALYRRGITHQPYLFQTYNNLGSALTAKGDMEEAERMFRKVISLKPDCTTAIYRLAHIHKYKSADHEDAKHILALLKVFTGATQDKIQLYFALGKIYDDSGAYDKAFPCFREANQLINAALAYNPSQWHQFTNDIIDTFSKDFLAQSFSFSSSNQQPVFIIGMPRSGTTLVANILSNHPDVLAAGELTNMQEYATLLPSLFGGAIPYPQVAKRMTHAAASKLIKGYEKALRKNARPDVRYIIDKHPLNFKHLGLITILFPKARIIHCTRNPMDTCLSNYFQYFDTTHDYSFDLKNIGHFYNEYERFMAHWREALPIPMLEISYEDIVMDIEPAVRKTLDFLGLEWNARCLAPHTNTRVVQTASVWQVRQPVYKQAVERWRRYEKYLGPLKEALR